LLTEEGSAGRHRSVARAETGTIVVTLRCSPSVFGLAASFLMSRASNFSAATNVLLGALFVLALAGLLVLIVILTERVTFG
jgi:hypothetical protein